MCFNDLVSVLGVDTSFVYSEDIKTLDIICLFKLFFKITSRQQRLDILGQLQMQDL